MANVDLNEKVKELKSRYRELSAKNDENAASWGINDAGAVELTAEKKQAFQTNIKEMHAVREQFEMIEQQLEAKEWGGQPANEAYTPQAQAQAARPGGFSGGQAAFERKTLGGLYTASDEFKSLQASGSFNQAAPWVYNGDMGAKWVGSGNMEQKDVYSSDASGPIAGGFRPLYRDDIVVQAFRKVRVRDLFPVQSTTAGIIEYFRVTGFVAGNNASTVPERLNDNSNFALKPHTSLNFQGRQAPTRTIAHWEAAHRNVLNDVPQLQGIIDTELLYGLRLQEDYQILQGTGTGEDLGGILNDSAIQHYTGHSPRAGAVAPELTTDTKSDDIRRAATKAILSYYEPTGVVMNPLDWESIETLKDSTGAYIIAIAVALGAEQRIWRLPVVDTPAMPQGTALVGAFGLGATLYDREEGSVRVAEQHADFFLRNALVVLAEERIALAVKRPESFVSVTLGA